MSADQRVSAAAVFAGGHSGDLFENFVEVSGIIEAAFCRHGDHIEFYSLMEDDVDGLVNPFCIDVIPGGESANLFK